MTEIKQQERINYLDTLRVLACFLVILCHAGDKYVVADTGGGFDTVWMNFLILTRPCVPLFILLSGTLLLPLKYTASEFYKRRFTRILLPFLIWSILYVVFPLPETPVFGGPANEFTAQVESKEISIYLYNLMMIPMNFTKSNVHFWFIYSIIGLYLFMPIISPWIKNATRKELKWFLMIWTVTLFFPYIRLWFPQIHGECDWNSFGMLYYFGGYIGYIILGLYLHRYNKLSAAKSCIIGVILFIIGFILTNRGMIYDINRMNSQIVADVNGEGWKIIENAIGYLTINVALMTAGTFMFFQKLRLPEAVQSLMREFSKMSYGLFLAHYIICLWVSAKLIPLLDINRGVEQFAVSILIFALSYLVAKVISYIPGSKYIIG